MYVHVANIPPVSAETVGIAVDKCLGGRMLGLYPFATQTLSRWLQEIRRVMKPGGTIEIIEEGNLEACRSLLRPP